MHHGRPWGSRAAVRAALAWAGLSEWPMSSWVSGSEPDSMLGGPSSSHLVYPGHSQGQRVSLTPTLPENWERASTSGSRCCGPHAERLLETRCLQEARGPAPSTTPSSPVQASTEKFNSGQAGLSQGPTPPPLADKIFNCLRLPMQAPVFSSSVFSYKDPEI